MRELVDSIHAYMWEFTQQQGLEIDPVQLRRNISRQVSSALRVVAPTTLEKMGHAKIAVLIDVASRYDLTLGELFHEMVTDGVQRSATLARDLSHRKRGVQRTSQRPRLRLVT